MLMARYEGIPIIPAQTVCADFFTHLEFRKFLRKVNEGQIALPLVRMENSQKSARGVHVADLAKYLDDQRAAALREHNQMHRK